MSSNNKPPPQQLATKRFGQHAMSQRRQQLVLLALLALLAGARASWPFAYNCEVPLTIPACAKLPAAERAPEPAAARLP